MLPAMGGRTVLLMADSLFVQGMTLTLSINIYIYNIYHLQTVQVHIFIIHIICRNVQSCDKRSHPELAGAEIAFIYSRNQGMTLQISDNLTASHIRYKCNMIKSYQILKYPKM